MSVDYKLIGGRIQQRRKALKLTQEQLAETLQVTVGYVSQIERGITKPNLDMLSAVCAALDLDLGALLTGIVRERESYLDEELAQKCATLTVAEKRLALRLIEAIKEP